MSERRASLEKDDVRADPETQPGKADMDGQVRARRTPVRRAGVVAAACTQGKRTQHGKPHCVIRDDQPDAREGQAGRFGVAERLAVPLKPGNASGGKGPWFKTNARSGEGPGIGKPSNSENCSKAADGVARESEAEAGYRFYALYDKIGREDILAHAYAQCRSNKGAPGISTVRDGSA